METRKTGKTKSMKTSVKSVGTKTAGRMNTGAEAAAAGKSGKSGKSGQSGKSGKSGQPSTSTALAASVNTPAKLARQQELCGSRPGGTAAYYFSERCIAKRQLDGLMEKNRRGAAYVGQIVTEMPVLESAMKAADPTPEELQVVFNDPIATEELVRFMTTPGNMQLYPSPNDRYAAAVSKLGDDHKNVSQIPTAFKKLVFRQVYNQFHMTAQNFKKFHGRASTNHGGKSV